jgi:adenylyltransferase/sulfurtransferase
VLTFDGLAHTFHTLKLPRDPACPVCGGQPTIRQLRAEDYETACVPAVAATSPAETPLEISVVEAKRQLDATPDRTLLIDVREPYEWQICRIANSEHVPMRQIPARVDALPKDKHLMIICHTGVRSRRVTEFLRAQGFPAVSNVAGGIASWADQIDPTLQRY